MAHRPLGRYGHLVRGWLERQEILDVVSATVGSGVELEVDLVEAIDEMDRQVRTVLAGVQSTP